MISFRVSLLPFTDLLSRPDVGSARKLISQHARLNMGTLDVSEPPASYVMVGRRLAIGQGPHGQSPSLTPCMEVCTLQGFLIFVSQFVPSPVGQGLHDRMLFTCAYTQCHLYPQDSMKIRITNSIGSKPCSLASVAARGSFLRTCQAMSIVDRPLQACYLRLRLACIWRR
jgi:hypothetical protein